MLISIILCSIIYTTQNTPLRVGAVPSFGNDTDKPPAPRAFCVMEQEYAFSVGQRYGKWVVDDLLGKNTRGQLLVKCKCDCGTERAVKFWYLSRGLTKSCGCANREIHTKRLVKHGLKKHPLFTIWWQMKQRCYSEKIPNFHRYGGRGIKVCDKWGNDFKKFHDWAIANKWQRGLSLDRINNDGNYEPSNCRWATRIQQARNRSDNFMVEHQGEIKCVSEWSKIFNIDWNRIYRGVKKGHSLAEIIAKPLYKQFKKTQ